MSDIPNAKPEMIPFRFGTPNAPCTLQEFDAMKAALPDDVKASADLYAYAGPYDFCCDVDVVPHPGLSRVTTFPKLLDALALLHGANREYLAGMAQELRRVKAAMDAAAPSQTAQVVPAVAAASKVDVSDARLIELHKQTELPISQILNMANLSNTEYYRRLKPYFDNGTLVRRTSQTRPKRVPNVSQRRPKHGT